MGLLTFTHASFVLVIFASLALVFAGIAAVSLSGALALLVAIRPSLDIFSEYTLVLARWLPSINVAGGIALVVIGVSVGILLTRLSQLQRLPLRLPIALVMGMAVVGLPFGELGTGLAETVRLATFFIVYAVVFVLVRTERDMYRVFGLMLASSAIPALVGAVEYLTGRGIYTNPGFDNRIMATFGHPNVFAYFLVIMLAVASMLWLRYHTEWTVRTSRLFRMYVAILGGLLIATYTRGAWIAAFVVLGTFAWRHYRTRALVGAGLGVGLGLVLLTMSSFLNLYTPAELPNFERIPVYERVTDLFEGNVSDSVLWRIRMWKDMWGYAWESPWIGEGTGQVKEAVESVRGVALGSLEVHNDYLRIFVEWGLIGVGVSLVSLGLLIRALIGRFRAWPHPVLALSLALTLGLCIAAGWDNILRQTANMWLFFGMLGAILKWYEIRQNEVCR